MGPAVLVPCPRLFLAARHAVPVLTQATNKLWFAEPFGALTKQLIIVALHYSIRSR